MLFLLGPPAIATANGLQPLDLRPKAHALLARVALTDEPQERAVLPRSSSTKRPIRATAFAGT